MAEADETVKKVPEKSKETKEVLETITKELEELVNKQKEIDSKIKEAGILTADFPLILAGPDAKRLEESLATIEAQIRNIKLVQKQYEIYNIPKSQECCPDVCASIKKMRVSAEDEFKNIEFYRDDMVATLVRLGIRVYPKTRVQKQQDMIKERMNELDDLMKVLEINKICKCE